MTIGRLNGSKTVAIPANSPDTQLVQTPKPQGMALKDTYEETKPPSDLIKALGQNTAQLKSIVQAGESANPTLNPQSQTQEHYGTSNNSFLNGPQNHPDRLGLNSNPEDTDLKQQLDQRAGFAFDPNRDLNIPGGGIFSTSTKDPFKIGGKPSSDNSEINSLKQENQNLKEQNDLLQAQLVQQQIKQSMDDLDKRNAYIEQKNKEAMEYARKAMEAAKNPNPDAPDNSSGGAMDPLINNLGSSMQIRQPFVDPVDEQEFEPSGVMQGRDQAVDPNPDADANIGAAQKAILSTFNAVTDPLPNKE